MSKLQREQIAVTNIHYRLYPFEYFLDAQQKLGVKSIELVAQAPHFWMDTNSHQDCNEVRKMVEDRGMTIVAFLPDNGIKYQYPLCAWNEVVYQHAISYYTNAIKVASELGVKVMTINCAGGTLDQDVFYTFEKAVESLRKLAPVAEKHDVTIAVEPMSKETSPSINTLKELQRLLVAVDHPYIKAGMDICNVTAAYETIDQWFDALGKDIVYIHFTDGKPSGHMVWGQGLHPLDQYIKVLNNYNYKGYLGQNINVRGMVFDPSNVNDDKGYIGEEFLPDNYWMTPSAASKKNMEALNPFLMN